MERIAPAPIQPHHTRPAAVWSAGGADYDRISHGIPDAPPGVTVPRTYWIAVGRRR